MKRRTRSARPRLTSRGKLAWRSPAIAVLLVGAAGGCAGAETASFRRETRTLVAALAPLDGGSGAGRAVFVEARLVGVSPVPERAARLTVEVSGHTAGLHGIAILAGGCDTPAHLNPDGGIHGRLHDVRGHAGDLGNIAVDADGRGAIDVSVLTAFGAEDVAGRAIAVFAAPDDGRTQPDGGAGAPVLCGVFGP